MIPKFNPPPAASLSQVDRATNVLYDDSCTIVEGVIAEGQGAWCGMTGDYDVHSLTFAGWRLPGTSLVAQNLLVMKPIPPYMRNQLSIPKTTFTEFPDYSIQRFSLLLSKDRTRSVFEKALPIEQSDSALESFAKQLREPVIVATKRFGNVTLRPGIGIFEGDATWYRGSLWRRNPIKISLEPTADGSIQDALATAEILWSDAKNWKRRIEDFAVLKLLPIRDDSWLDEGEPETTAADFKKRMKLNSITASPNGLFEFWHEDGGLFQGHWIQVRGNVRDGPTSADIPG